MKTEPMPRIVIDSREQLPYAFDGCATVVRALPTGDYSLSGLEAEVCVERKQRVEAWQMVAGERRRFEDCLHRLAAITRPMVVIECSLHEFAVQPAEIQRVRVSSAVGSWLSWSAQYRIPIIWAGSREYGERVTYRWLRSYFKHRDQILDRVYAVGRREALVEGITEGICKVIR